MRMDYHMHFEKGSYDEAWVEGFFEAAKKRGLAEIGISEHSHTFPEFKELYYEDLVLDDSFIGKFQQQWLKTNKFKYTLDEYFAFMHKLQQKHQVKIGIEVCNFQDQAKVRDILKDYDFDYIIGSVHSCTAGPMTRRKSRRSGRSIRSRTSTSGTRRKSRSSRTRASTMCLDIRSTSACSATCRISM